MVEGGQRSVTRRGRPGVEADGERAEVLGDRGDGGGGASIVPLSSSGPGGVQQSEEVVGAVCSQREMGQRGQTAEGTADKDRGIGPEDARKLEDECSEGGVAVGEFGQTVTQVGIAQADGLQ